MRERVYRQASLPFLAAAAAGAAPAATTSSVLKFVYISSDFLSP